MATEVKFNATNDYARAILCLKKEGEFSILNLYNDLIKTYITKQITDVDIQQSVAHTEFPDCFSTSFSVDANVKQMLETKQTLLSEFSNLFQTENDEFLNSCMVVYFLRKFQIMLPSLASISKGFYDHSSDQIHIQGETIRKVFTFLAQQCRSPSLNEISNLSEIDELDMKKMRTILMSTFKVLIDMSWCAISYSFCLRILQEYSVESKQYYDQFVRNAQPIGSIFGLQKSPTLTFNEYVNKLINDYKDIKFDFSGVLKTWEALLNRKTVSVHTVIQQLVQPNEQRDSQEEYNISRKCNDLVPRLEVEADYARLQQEVSKETTYFQPKVEFFSFKGSFIYVKPMDELTEAFGTLFPELLAVLDKNREIWLNKTDILKTLKQCSRQVQAHAITLQEKITYMYFTHVKTLVNFQELLEDFKLYLDKRREIEDLIQDYSDAQNVERATVLKGRAEAKLFEFDTYVTGIHKGPLDARRQLIADLRSKLNLVNQRLSAEQKQRDDIVNQQLEREQVARDEKLQLEQKDRDEWKTPSDSSWFKKPIVAREPPPVRDPNIKKVYRDYEDEFKNVENLPVPLNCENLTDGTSIGILPNFVVSNIPASKQANSFMYDTLRKTNGELVFSTQEEFATFIKENCVDRSKDMFKLNYDMNDPRSFKATLQTLQVSKWLNLVTHVDDQFLFEGGAWTFWDNIPTIIVPEDTVVSTRDMYSHLLYTMIKKYTSRLCRDTISRHKVGWFLVQWVLNRQTAESVKHILDVNNGGAIDDAKLPGIVLLNHAMNILDMCIGLEQNPLVASGMFQPFIRGFIDNPDSWNLSKSGNELLLRLPDDPNDAMATILRAHPNTYMVRLSPNKPMHLDFIMYKIVDEEKDQQNKYRRKYKDFVVFFSINMVDPGMPSTCPAPMVILCYLMNHMHERNNRYFMSFMQVLDIVIRHRATHKEFFTAPIMANYGSAQQYYSVLCTDTNVRPSVPVFPNYSQSVVNMLRSQTDLFAEMVNRIYDKSVNLLASYNIVERYEGYLQTSQFCDTMFATIDNFGDPGCSVSPQWMIQTVPPQPPNALMKRIYDYVLEKFYSNSLWECERTVAGFAKEKIGYEDSAEYNVRNQQIWHLIRWLGIDFFIQIFQEKDPLKPTNARLQLISSGLLHVLNASYAYPFFSSEMAETMLEQLGGKHGFVWRLSTSQPLAFEKRYRNPDFNPDNPYMAEYLYTVIPDRVWLEWLAGASPEYMKLVKTIRTSGGLKQIVKTIGQDISIRTPLYTDDELTFYLQEYLFRRGFYEKYNFTLVRNLRIIEQYLTSCNVDVSARRLLVESRIWFAFRDTSNEDALNRLDVIVEKAFPNRLKEWADIKSRTLTLNSRGEYAIIGTVSDACRPGTYLRIDFYNLSKPVCDENPNWMLEQPLLTEKFLTGLKSSDKRDRPVLKAVQDTVKLLKTSENFATNWCVSGKRGDRNISVVLNWLGFDTVMFVSNNISKLSDQTFRPKSVRDNEHLLSLNAIMELSADPVFHLLLTPPEAELLANKYPGFAIVSLSHVSPHTLSITYMDPADIYQVRKSELDMSEILPLYNPAMSLALLIQLIIYQMYRVHLTPAMEQVDKWDREGCGKTDQKRPTQRPKYFVNFTSGITSQYASQIQSMFMSVEEDIDSVNSGPDLTADQQRLQITAPRLAMIQEYKEKFGRFAGFLRSLPEKAWRSSKNALKEYTQWWSNPSNELYQSGTVNGPQFTEEIKSRIERFQAKEAKYVQENFAETDMPKLLENIQSLEKQCIRYREREFREGVIVSKEERESFVNAFKGALYVPAIKDFVKGVKETYGSLKDKLKSPTSADDTIYNDLKFMKRVSPAAASQLLLEKINGGGKLGTGELKIGVELGMLDQAGNLIKPGMAPTYVPRTTIAGPLSDVGGPPFQNIKSDKWKEYNEVNPGDYERMGEGFELDEGCAENGPDYVFPAFDVDGNGTILPRCGRPGWMSAARTITGAEIDKLDDSNKRLLLAIRNMAKHWCPTIEHELKLWRWIGISCLGRVSVEILSTDALDRLDDPVESSVSPVKQLATQSKEEQRKLIAQLRKFRERAQAKSSKQPREDVCKKRILFLQQMISSNILFPYINDSKNARLLASYNPDRVVVMLGWAKSGSVVCMKDGRKFLEHTYQAEDIVEYIQYVPTTVRLLIFKDFYGGLAANNYDFYRRILHNAGKEKCLKSLADMKRFAVRAALPLSDQRRLDRTYGEVVASGGNVTPEQRNTLNELQNISLLLQAKNLTTTELFVYEELRKLENMDPKQSNELAERLFKSKEVDTRHTEAEQFEALALCQKPEFVPYLRKKLKDKYPELTVAEIEAMDRETLCRALVNDRNIEAIKLPVLVWQIKNVPFDFRDENGMLDIWTGNPGQQSNIDGWLMKNYGVTLAKVRDDNKNSYDQDILTKQAQLFKQDSENRVLNEGKRLEDMVEFREFLTNGAKCERAACDKEFMGTNGASYKLKDGDSELSVLNLFSIIFAGFCHPSVPLLMNDFEFILQSFNALRNYFVLREYKDAIPTERRLDKQCKTIQRLYNKLMDDVGDYSWANDDLKTIMTKETVKKLYDALLKGVTGGTPLHLAWSAFSKIQRSEEQKCAFAVAVLLVIAKVNGIITF